MTDKAGVLVYTFRSFPFQLALREKVESFFVFGKLKSDIEIFKSLIAEKKPALILGLARSTSGVSCFEVAAINQFNRNGKITTDGPASYKLSLPSGRKEGIKIAVRSTHSFCNWTMYKIAETISGRKDTRLMFAHVIESDLATVLRVAQCPVSRIGKHIKPHNVVPMLPHRRGE